MDKAEQLLETANKKLKESNAGIKILKRGQKLSLRGVLPKKDVAATQKSQQVISLGIYSND